MRAFTLIVLACLVASLAYAGVNEKSETEKAEEATREFGKALKTELMAAMKSGGPLEAIDVCNVKAAEIADAVSLEEGMSVSRVSLRNRNPGNAPNEWQMAVLESFESRKLAGEDAGALSWHEKAPTENGDEFRFMKAIPTGALCLQCHGQALAPTVTEKLAELYPEDKATGFREGDIRGAFVVTRSHMGSE